MRGKKKRRRSAGAISVTLIVIAFMAVMAVQLGRLKEKDARYAAKEQELLEEAEQERLRSTELDELEDTVKSSEYIESIARSKLGLTKDKENEIIFKEIGEE
ncbi:MAG: septum formation initiator family protein [Muribaculaceae bacterium]|nr:septum formation initiator family protein [Roseburia sp.]MCM1431407.1 septum formation initiator family protein [Muribaculaceae bacterium]MCM1491849.1 septum formation initiator family protein [Muribaculaceae bacterium]